MSDEPTTMTDQHPTYEDAVQGTTWMAHCNVCGLYVEDWHSEPPVDFLCDDCQGSTDD